MSSMLREIAEAMREEEERHSRATKEIAEQIMAQPSMQERLKASEHATQAPPVNPPDGVHENADIWRLANLAQKYRDRIVIVATNLENGPGVLEVDAVVHDPNNGKVRINAHLVRDDVDGDPG